jgi:hypothetical protein
MLLEALVDLGTFIRELRAFRETGLFHMSQTAACGGDLPGFRLLQQAVYSELSVFVPSCAPSLAHGERDRVESR